MSKIPKVIGFVTTSSSSIADQTNLYFFYGPNYTKHRIYKYNELNQTMVHPSFQPDATTTIYIHGYSVNISDPTSSIWNIVDAYSSRHQNNLIVYDYSALDSGEYFTGAVPNAVTVSF